MKLTTNNSALVLIDVQEKLLPVMADKEALIEKLSILIQGARIFGLPIYWMEQYPKGLGPTVGKLAGLLEGYHPISKTSFSACGEEKFMDRLKADNRKHILVAGIESHVCVYQTARDLVEQGYYVEVVVDATSSRCLQNKRVAMEKLSKLGGHTTSVEIALFDMLQTSDSPHFKAISRLVR